MCVKDGNVKENAGIVQTAKEYQVQAVEQADKTIEVCIKGELTPNKAGIELARQFATDRRNLQQTMQNLENSLGTGKAVINVDVRMIPEGRVNVVIYNDNTVRAFECRRGGEVIPVMPNPNFRPTVFGTKLRFVDIEGESHRSAEDVVTANMRVEEVSNRITHGKCPQDPKFVPDFLPDPSRM